MTCWSLVTVTVWVKNLPNMRQQCMRSCMPAIMTTIPTPKAISAVPSDQRPTGKLAKTMAAISSEVLPTEITKPELRSCSCPSFDRSSLARKFLPSMVKPQAKRPQKIRA